MSERVRVRKRRKKSSVKAWCAEIDGTLAPAYCQADKNIVKDDVESNQLRTVYKNVRIVRVKITKIKKSRR